MGEALDIMKTGSKSWVIWLSCIDKDRSLKQIMEEWHYKTGAGALYRSDIVEAMVKDDIIKPVKIGKETTFTSQFGWLTKSVWNNLIRDRGLTNLQRQWLNAISEMFDIYIPFLDKNRELLTLEGIKRFYNNDFKSVAMFPLNIFTMPLSAYIYYFLFPKSKRALLEKQIVTTANMMSPFDPAIMFDTAGYFKTLDEKRLKDIANDITPYLLKLKRRMRI